MDNASIMFNGLTQPVVGNRKPICRTMHFVTISVTIQNWGKPNGAKARNFLTLPHNRREDNTATRTVNNSNYHYALWRTLHENKTVREVENISPDGGLINHILWTICKRISRDPADSYSHFLRTCLIQTFFSCRTPVRPGSPSVLPGGYTYSWWDARGKVRECHRADSI